MDLPSEEVTEAPPPPPPAVAGPLIPPEIGFGNRIAVRASLLAAAVSLVLMMVIPLLFLVVLVAAGFASVWLYRRRTGQELSVGSGARMGWLTGLFCFVFAAVLMTVQIVIIGASPEARDTFKQQAETQGLGVDPEAVIEMLLSPSGIVGVLMVMFVMLTVLPVVGGAMGAKVLEKE